MISPQKFVDSLEIDIKFVTGVPDSLLKEVCACITSSLNSDRHIIAANEGSTYCACNKELSWNKNTIIGLCKILG